jgi:hypothetical protein
MRGFAKHAIPCEAQLQRPESMITLGHRQKTMWYSVVSTGSKA